MRWNKVLKKSSHSQKHFDEWSKELKVQSEQESRREDELQATTERST